MREKEILKNKTVLKGITLGSITILLFTILIGIFIITQKNERIRLYQSSPELSRAMNYHQISKEEKAVDETDGNVLFSAFFLRDITGDGYAEELEGTCKQIGDQDTLYMELNVQTEGYLKNGKIEIQGKNFYLQTNLVEDAQLKQNYIGNNIKTIELEDIANGTQKLITGIIRSGEIVFMETSVEFNESVAFSTKDNISFLNITPLHSIGSSGYGESSGSFLESNT